MADILDLGNVNQMHITVNRLKRRKPVGCQSAWSGRAFTLKHLLLASIAYSLNPALVHAQQTAPELFTYDELVQLYERETPTDALQSKLYLNNVIEQDHRFVKKKVRASQCFKRLHTAERTPEGIEAVTIMRKGQVKRLSGNDAHSQAKFVASLFEITA